VSAKEATLANVPDRFDWEAFLRRELAPTPGRWQATLRLALAVTVVTYPILTHRIPEASLVLLIMYFLAQEDTGTTLLASVLAAMGTLLGCGFALLCYLVAFDLPWLRIVLMFAAFAGGLFLTRTLTLSVLALPFGVSAGFLLTIPDVQPDPELAVELVLWTWWCITLGIATNLAVQWLLSPGDPKQLLMREVASRLTACSAALSRAGGVGELPSSSPSATALALAGPTRPMKLLKSAIVRHPILRPRSAELRALVTLADRLVVAAAAFEALPIVATDDTTRARLRRAIAECDHIRKGVESDARPETANSPLPGTAESSGPLAEIERVLAWMPEVWPGGAPSSTTLQAELVAAEAPTVFVPDAFTNPEHVHFALKGAISCLLCYAIYTALDWPGIYTSVITSYVVPLSTLGATTQKGVLRFAGAAAGAVLGIATLAGIFPHLDSVGGFWIVLAGGTCLGGWLAFGSTRIAYAGIQLGFAFYKTILQGFGPVTGLTVPRDRVIGIGVGLAVLGLVEQRLWPRRAGDQLHETIARAMRDLAQLARVRATTPSVPLGRRIEGLRLRLDQDFARALQLLEESRFEAGGADHATMAQVISIAQALFLLLLGRARHVESAPQDFEDAVATDLEHMASGRNGGPEAGALQTAPGPPNLEFDTGDRRAEAPSEHDGVSRQAIAVALSALAKAISA